MTVSVKSDDNNNDNNILMETRERKVKRVVLCIDWSGVISRPGPLSHIIES